MSQGTGKTSTDHHPGPNAWLLEELASKPLPQSTQTAVPTQQSQPQLDHSAGASAPAATPAAAATPPAAAATPSTPPAAPPAPAPKTAAVKLDDDQKADASPLRGASARIVDNMEDSLGVPTATSFRDVPAKLLEANRRVLNGYMVRSMKRKISFTHLICWAAIRAITDHVPAMNSTFAVDEANKPYVLRSPEIGLGVAVDVEKRDGTRNLMVPTLKDAGNLSFKEFLDGYNDIVARARSNKLTLEDFGGTTVSVTNPGGIGTVQSVPRLMPGQAVIVGVGTIALPAAWQSAEPETVARLGISKVVTITSTYDHRVIQGAESGEFLKAMHELLCGQHDFYKDLFDSVGVPYQPINFNLDRFRRDHGDSGAIKQIAVNQCVNMHRVRGHMIADLDPLGMRETTDALDVDPETYGLTVWDLDREFLHTDYANAGKGPVRRMLFRDMLKIMRDAYCRTVGIDYMHIQNPAEKRWIQTNVEGVSRDPETVEEKKWLLDWLIKAEGLENFLDKKYPGIKRFGIDGSESAIPIMATILGDAADQDFNSAVIGMAHRGRLNAMVNITGKPYEALFNEFEVGIDEDSVQGSGDVKYHRGYHGTFTSMNGKQIPVQLAANPSHLEAVDPVVEGIARANMDLLPPPGDDELHYPVVPLLVHGDAAFAGQGVVAETLVLSQIKGYQVGGTIHLIINNQVGYTTTAEAQRSSPYSTDVARMVQAPILHVNGDDPEACAWVAHLAFEYRKTFHKDVVIDMWCYRRHGHNEGDDPSYTQPLMYRKIETLAPVREKYLDKLVFQGVTDAETAQSSIDALHEQMQTALDTARANAPSKDLVAKPPPPPVGVLAHIDTSIDEEAVKRVFSALTNTPEGFSVHPKLQRQFDRRNKLFESGLVDWALAETIAFGSLLDQGISVRLAGEDSRRGTFAHRHSTLVNFDTGEEFRPLNQLRQGDSQLWIYDSPLSEYAALGFEYGYSISNPDALVIWEAQFGDFVNGAQIIIDQFIVSAEDKWKQTSGLTLLLPHGYEGQGPEHSSARLERFLSASAEDNIQVVNATTAAQFFHLLRRQVLRDVRKPLIIFAPKSLLRAQKAQSPVSELTSGTFLEALDDPRAEELKDTATTIALCSGKVAYDMMEARDAADAKVAVMRVEQLYPWPKERTEQLVSKYKNAKTLIWLQEEPENMGAWTFARGRMFKSFGESHTIRRVSRFESGSPATGSTAIHNQEQRQLTEEVIEISKS